MDTVTGRAAVTVTPAEAGEVCYYPWGKDRFTSGTTPASFTFAGQRFEDVITAACTSRAHAR